MKKYVAAAMLGLLGCVIVVRSALAITEAQSYACPVVESLGLQRIPSDKIGGPQQYRITEDTIKLLTQFSKDKRIVIVENDGSITVK
ncbi:hypothetical protein Psta_0706 [Pirellula staleyi DSM 6068]|uniref:Lipoprotein n=1 Tax=Pirellula staleyi (strain ATCC 27377 / DSM 6068 / ICPB 4128) TaxID=530564 RepID=D2R5D3_PIRSD|nr:hypothetical protein [Pirellula staleyi]ADB15392.1 hypothetical protein Psta_0706 [Pirellula staleyi DSM 6068]